MRFGTRVSIAGVSHFPYSQVSRCTLEAVGGVPSTVIVRLPRDDPARSGLARLRNEQAALAFLNSIGSTLAPGIVAGDAAAGVLVTEDLGTAPSLLDLLLGDDREAAGQGLLDFARGLGTLHAQTAGRASAYAVRRAQLGPADPDAEDAARFHVAKSWQHVQEAVARLRLPLPRGVDRDVAEVVRTLATPGAYVALSSGDPSPVNCTITQGAARFFDFEGATFRHALIDATVLRYLYPTGGPPGAYHKTWPTGSNRPTGRRWHRRAPAHATTLTTKAAWRQRVPRGRSYGWCGCRRWRLAPTETPGCSCRPAGRRRSRRVRGGGSWWRSSIHASPQRARRARSRRSPRGAKAWSMRYAHVGRKRPKRLRCTRRSNNGIGV